MPLGILTGIREFFNPWGRQSKKIRPYDTFCCEQPEALAFEVYAIELAINRLSNAITQSDFETYKNGKQTQEKNWWLLNYEPNANDNKATFWHSVIEEMVWNPDGALIIQSNAPDDGSLVVAESFQIKEFAFEENLYTGIQLEGGLGLSAPRGESEVIRLQLGNGRVRQVIDGVYKHYGKLIGGSIKTYNRGNSMKLLLKIDSAFNQFDKIELENGERKSDYILDDLFENRFKGLMSEKDSVTPLEEGLHLEKAEAGPGNAKPGVVTTRDIANVFDDILNIVADAFLIPRGLLKGDVADVEAMTNNFINQCVTPLAEQIQAEFNRKLYGFENVKQGTKLKVNPTTILTRDPVKFANAGEALFRSGAYSTNDIRKKLGEEPIREEWADEHYITKNYGTTDEAQESEVSDSADEKD